MVASGRSPVLIIVGLTGPIAGGKSTVAGLLAERGADVIDCDRLAREATTPGSPALDDIRERFGSAVLQPDGALDRGALGRIVFDDPQAMADLEAIVHPRVTAAKDGRLHQSEADVAVIEAIKLVEAGYAAQCDEVWVVTAHAAVRERRLVNARGLDRAVARQRIAAQTNLPLMLRVADRVIQNNDDLDRLRAQVAQAWQALIAGGPA